MSDRELLILLVRAGRMTPEEAEAEAAKQGFRKLADAPHPAEFDPLEEARWTLFMVLAWIIWRTPDAVRNQWDEYRIACQDWITPQGTEYRGMVLERRRPATWASLLAQACWLPERLIEMAEAKDGFGVRSASGSSTRWPALWILLYGAEFCQITGLIFVSTKLGERT